MISSTRSSESAPRSSWNDASSLMFSSGICNWSVRTSLTFSYTSSRDAAMSPHWSGVEARRSYNAGLLAQPGCEPPHHVVLDAAGRETDGVLDRARRGIAVGDHREAAQAEQVGAAIGVRIEAMPEVPGSRADQETADLAASTRGYLGAQAVENRANRPFQGLEDDVAGEAVGDDHVGGAAQDVAPLAVALEVEV